MAMQPITSVQNPRFKSALQLTRNRHRKQQAEFLIQGAREIQRALAAGISLSSCFCSPPRCDPQELQLLAELERRQIPIWSVPGELLSRLQYGEAQAGMLVVAKALPLRLADAQLGTTPLVVVCDHLEKPGNVGAIIRTADAVAASAVILADPLVDCFHPNVIRTSTGCVFTTPLFSAAGAEVRAWLERQQFHIYAADPAAETSYDEVAWTAPLAIVFGNEAGGLSPVWRSPGLQTFRLPMAGVADSLNVSVTAAVVLFEVQRRRRVTRAGRGGAAL